VCFPGLIQDCATCHLAGTEALPLRPTVRATRFDTLDCAEAPGADGNGFCNQREVVAREHTPPRTVICTSCHDSPAAIAHAELNTTAGGVEACDVCHGAGSETDPARWHRRLP
jgi:hypothetical protein